MLSFIRDALLFGRGCEQRDESLWPLLRRMLCVKQSLVLAYSCLLFSFISLGTAHINSWKKERFIFYLNGQTTSEISIINENNKKTFCRKFFSSRGETPRRKKGIGLHPESPNALFEICTYSSHHVCRKSCISLSPLIVLSKESESRGKRLLPRPVFVL